MDYKIFYTEDALADLESILDYIGRDSEEQARRFGTELLNHVELLARFPRLGRPVPGRKNVRLLVHTPVRIYYKIDFAAKRIDILHFWHSARRPPLEQS